MAPRSGDMLPAAPERKRYRRHFPPRRRQRRQVKPAVEEKTRPAAEEEISSASEDDGVDSGMDSDGIDSESEDDESYSPVQSTPTPIPDAGSTASALTTFQVGTGGVVATSLPGASADVEPPLNVGLPGTVTAPASETTATEAAGFTSVTTLTESPTAEATPRADMEFGHDDQGHREEMKKGNDTSKHVMIGAASIGTFIGVCIFGWLFWRVTRAKKRRHGKDSLPWSGSRPRISRQAQLGKILGRIPWVKSQPWALRWQALGDDDTVPITREKQGRPSDPGGYPAPNERDATNTARPVSLQRVVVPPLETNLNLNFNPAAQTASPGGSHTVSPLSAGTAVPNPAVVASHHQQQASFGSLDNQGGTWVYASPTQAQAQRDYRSSEVSSLSSGFGDGAIIIPAAYQPADAAPRQPPSTRTRSSVGGDASSNRDTMYTATSEDQPARYRSISSWVDQQTGRIRRAQQRAKDGVVVVPGGDEGVPPVPGVPAGAGENGLPPEPVFNMMMPDGEVPRRVEER